MKKTAVVFFVLFFSAYDFFAQADYVNKAAKAKAVNPKIYFDAYNYAASDSGKTKIRIFFQVPFTSLSFVKKNGKFASLYSIEVAFYDSSGSRMLFEKIWKERVFVRDYSKAINRNNFNLTYKEIELPPAFYKLKITLIDKYALSKVHFVKKIRVRKIDPAFGVSDIMLFDRKIKRGGKEELVPNVKNIVTTGSDSLNVFYYAYSNKDRNVLINYRLYSFKSDEAFIVNESVLLKKGKNKMAYTIKPVNFKLGRYNIRIMITDDATGEKLAIAKNIFARIKFFPPSITDLDLAIREMQYIATPTQIDDMLSTKDYGERLRKFEEFWKKKDPSPGTPINEVLYEYYRRVEYANKHFKHYFPGWKTDMGKVYITLGPPHQIDRHPLELDSKPYEVWYYYDINREFVFVDETGFGDYRLITPLYGDWYRYRN